MFFRYERYKYKMMASDKTAWMVRAGEGAYLFDDFQTLKENLTMNCIPETTFSMDIDNYNEFLMQRRLLMAKKIKDYYYSL